MNLPLALLCHMALALSAGDEARALHDALQRQAAEEMQRLPNDTHHPPAVSVVVMDVSRQVSVGVDATESVYLASGVKLFVLVELYRQRQRGSLSFDERLFFGDEDVRDGSPTLNRLGQNTEYRVADLITFMVRDSDNAAFDLLLRRAGRDNVEALAHKYGPMGAIIPTLETRKAVYGRLDPRAYHLDAAAIRDVRWRDGWHPRLDLLKRHLGPPAGHYHENEYDLAWAAHYATGVSSAPLITPARLLKALVRGKAVSPAVDAEILERLRHVATSDRRIEGQLPPEAIVAHKTGSLHKRLCDLGVVTLPDGTALIITVAVSGASYRLAEAAVARLSRVAWDVALDARKSP